MASLFSRLLQEANLSVPIDIVVVRTAYVQRYGDLIGTVVRPALHEGKVLYVR